MTVFVCQSCDVDRPTNDSRFGDFPRCPYCEVPMDLMTLAARENDKRLQELGWKT